jgi:hypothetical protein
MSNCFVDSCEQVQTRLDKKLTPKTLEANNLRRVMIIGGWSVRQDWEDSYRNWNIIPGCIISEGPEEAEELRSELTKGVGSEWSKGHALLVIFGGVEFTFIVLHGLQRVLFQDMAAGVGVAQREIHDEIGRATAIRSGTQDTTSSDHKIPTLHGVRLSDGHKAKASC